jgi:hypothetical protein
MSQDRHDAFTCGAHYLHRVSPSASQDALLAQLETALTTLGLAAGTDVMVVSCHGHSTVSGPLATFPPREIAGGAVGAVSTTAGYSVSGDVRLADLMKRAGFPAFDGSRCVYDPVLPGPKADGSQVYPTQVDQDHERYVCCERALSSRCKHGD